MVEWQWLALTGIFLTCCGVSYRIGYWAGYDAASQWYIAQTLVKKEGRQIDGPTS